MTDQTPTASHDNPSGRQTEAVAAHQGIADPAVAAICTIERAAVQAMVRLQEAARRTETTQGWELQA